MTARDRGHLRQQGHRDRPADDAALPDDHRVGAAHHHAAAADQLGDGQRGARHDDRVVVEQPADVRRAHALDVLVRIDAVLGCRGVDVRRQRQLEDDPGDPRVGVEPVDRGQQLGLRGCLGQLDQLVLDADLHAELALRLGIQPPAGIAADQNGAELDRPVVGVEPRDLAGDLGSDFGGIRRPVQNGGRHR